MIIIYDDYNHKIKADQKTIGTIMPNFKNNALGNGTKLIVKGENEMCEIRRLTPRECGRLMGVLDSDIDKMLAIQSNTQSYKQFGNSIVVDCIAEVFRNIDFQGKPVRLIELFAGYGSQAMALKRIGQKFEHWGMCELDKYAVAAYNAVHGTSFPVSDVTKLKGADLKIKDLNEFTYLLTYSFPCTDLSVAGKQKGMSKGSGTRSGLLWEVERILFELGKDLPQVLVMENVTQVHGKKAIDDFNDWLRTLESLGYKNYWKDLNAKDFGIPQNRNRCFMVSLLNGGEYKFPEGWELTKCMEDILEDEEKVEEKYYVRNDRTKALIEKLKKEGKIPERRQTVIVAEQGGN